MNWTAAQPPTTPKIPSVRRATLRSNYCPLEPTPTIK
jgi:hypothetical protein